jgi:hypothetical protein
LAELASYRTVEAHKINSRILYVLSAWFDSRLPRKGGRVTSHAATSLLGSFSDMQNYPG